MRFADTRERPVAHRQIRAKTARDEGTRESGVAGARAQEAQLAAQDHVLSPLFFQAHRLIAFVRAVDARRRGEDAG